MNLKTIVLMLCLTFFLKKTHCAINSFVDSAKHQLEISHSYTFSNIRMPNSVLDLNKGLLNPLPLYFQKFGNNFTYEKYNVDSSNNYNLAYQNSNVDLEGLRKISQSIAQYAITYITQKNKYNYQFSLNYAYYQTNFEDLFVKRFQFENYVKFDSIEKIGFIYKNQRIGVGFNLGGCLFEKRRFSLESNFGISANLNFKTTLFTTQINYRDWYIDGIRSYFFSDLADFYKNAAPSGFESNRLSKSFSFFSNIGLKGLYNLKNKKSQIYFGTGITINTYSGDWLSLGMVGFVPSVGYRWTLI